MMACQSVTNKHTSDNKTTFALGFSDSIIIKQYNKTLIMAECTLKRRVPSLASHSQMLSIVFALKLAACSQVSEGRRMF